MGFVANSYRDDESEFDIVFESPEGRFLGEAEGKDKRAINIDKFSQLERNLQEDFSRKEVDDYAKGVLFGNAFRLTPLEERGEAFTTKCLTAAKRLKVALVRTQDLFGPARYLQSCSNPEYAEACRKVLAQTEGELVRFPEPPEIATIRSIRRPTND